MRDNVIQKDEKSIYWTFTMMGHAELVCEDHMVNFLRAKKVTGSDGVKCRHGFMGMKSAADKKAVKKALGRSDAYVETMKGPQLEAYCAREKEFDFIVGDLPLDGAGSESCVNAKETKELIDPVLNLPAAKLAPTPANSPSNKVDDPVLRHPAWDLIPGKGLASAVLK